MSPEAQRIAIAEARGYSLRQVHGKYWQVFSPTIVCIGGVADTPDVAWQSAARSLPDYLSDLNATHEAEKVLTNEQRRRYARMLVEVHPLHYDPTNPGPLSCDGGAMNLFLIASMPAAQRAEAFLRTIGKWEAVP